MAKPKNSIYVPEVDRIKQGVNNFDPLKDVKDDEGFVKVTRSKAGAESRNRAITREITEQQDALKRLKEIADNYGMSKKDIKDTREDIEEDDYKKARKEERKRGERNELDSYFSSLINSGSMPTDFASYVQDGGEKGEKKKKKKKKKKDKERAKMAGLYVKEKKKDKDGEKKKKKDKDDEDAKNRSEVAERFREVEKISRGNMAEIDDTIDFINGRLNDLTSSAERLKNRDYVISNYISAKSTLISTRQKIATDIGSNRAKIYEIEMKKEKTARDASASDADMIARLFPGIALGGGMGKDINKYIAENGKNKDSKKKKKHKYWDEEDDDIIDDKDLDARERALMKSGDLEYSDYDENIEYEGQFKIGIKKAYTTGEWKFVGLDNDGNIIPGIPKSHFPSKKTCQMKFDDENDVAQDLNRNVIYPVIQVPTI